MYDKLPTSLCLQFIDPTNTVAMTKVITWIVVILRTATSLVILIMHILLGKNLKESQKSVRKSGSDNDTPLVIQLIIITVSNILCWFPENGIIIATIFLSMYPVDLIIWITTICLPLNSIINLFGFVIVAIRKYIKSRRTTQDRNPN